MAATSIWKSYGLDNEFRRLVGDTPSFLDPHPTGEARRVISATNAFAADAYSLPGGIDSRVREIYPSLMELSRESCYLSEANLEKMASDICKPQLQFPPTRTHYAPVDEPFAMGSPVAFPRPSESKTSPRVDTCSVYRPDYLNSDHPDRYLTADYPKGRYSTGDYPKERYPMTHLPMYQSVDRFATKGSGTTGLHGNIFDAENYRTRTFANPTTTGYNPPGGFNTTNTGYNQQGGFTTTTTGYNPPSGFNTTTTGYIPTTGIEHTTFTPINPRRGEFNFHRDFLSAFQPESEPRNDYRAMQTPVVDLGTRKKETTNIDTMVSPFPWERNMEAHRSSDAACTPRGKYALGSEQRYPSYISGRGNNVHSSATRRLRRFDDPLEMFDASQPPRVTTAGAVSDFVLRDFARSPLRSLMRDSDHSYGYKASHMTPRTLYHGLI
ncbi:NAC domain containing protein, putative [Babesia ovis]|uniref:NAC domain containing protein, putative n=1 Tax=Babesia ovis TaxID=5869 RepID=A0A9W5WTX1_BABOV|nr:NAC domain containing protein, putative [Babesia ovis]